MTSYEAIPGNKGAKQFKVLGSGTETDPYVPVMSVKVDPDVTSVTGWSSPLLDANVPSEKLVKETIDNQEVSSATFNTASGVLTLTKTDGNITVNLDGRYLTTITAIDADSVSVTNLEVDNFKGSSIVTEAEGISSNDNDTTIPTSAAVKDYVDNTVVPDTNTYVTSASFNTADGVLTLTLNDTSTVSVNLDGRFLQGLISDTSPQLGGNLDLNSNDITGTGNIEISGDFISPNGSIEVDTITSNTIFSSLYGEVATNAIAGESISRGDAIYIDGYSTTQGKVIIKKADADDASKMPAIGLSNDNAVLNSTCAFYTSGTVKNLDTSSFSVKDKLYVSTSGTLTNTQPTGQSAQIQNIGIVERSSSTIGQIRVFEVGTIAKFPNLTNGNVAIGNGSNQAELRALDLDDVAETASKKILTASEQTKLGYITATQSVNLDDQNIKQLATIKNNTASDYSAGSVLYYNGVSSANMIGSLFLANGTIDPHLIIGIASEDIIKGTTGKCQTFGVISGIDTSSFSVGNILYASTSVYGGLTATKPTSNQAIAVAVVLTSNVSGSIFVLNNKVDENYTGVIVDSTLSTTSTNPVENQAITNEINTKQDTITGTTDITMNALTANGNIIAKEDQDMSMIFGRLRIDSRYTDTWNLSHYDLPSTSEYQFSGNLTTLFLNGALYVRLQAGGSTIASVIDDGIEFQSGNNYYLRNNSNVLHRYNSSPQTPGSITTYYPVFGINSVINSDIYTYTTPSSSSDTGIKLLKAGKYKVSYTLNFRNVSYNNRTNFITIVVKHSSAITPTITEIPATKSFGYARDDNFAAYATTTATAIIDVSANEYIKCETKVAKNDTSFNDSFSGIDFIANSTIIVEYLGNI